jgi:rhodanese-related sulfurtransferase
MTIPQSISANDLQELINKQGKDIMLIDVRSLDEHKSGSIPDAKCIPHDAIVDNLDKIPKDKNIVLFCQAGKRSEKACQALKEKGFTQLTQLEGGFSAWASNQLPIKQSRKAISIQRQVMIAAGLLITTGASLGHFVNYSFWALSAFVGVGLFFAGVSGFCGMAILLEKMPWNKV